MNHGTSQSTPPLSFVTKLSYGIGAAAYGVKDNGFNYFLLIYYNQVLGLPAAQVALAGFIALCIDAISDPIVGNWSDRLRTKLGRRHPFMYLAALPVAISYFFFWNPPEMGPNELFVYLILMAVLVRTTITFYEIPSTALVAELTTSYHERTSVLGFRYFFGWLGGLAIAAFAFGFLLVPTEEYPYGLLNADGYGAYGLIAALIMITAILTSAFGTHSRIPYLKSAPPRRAFSILRVLGEVWETLSDRSFVMLFGTAILFAAGQGVSQALSYYFATFFWELKSHQLLYFIYAYVFSSAAAFWIAPRVSQRFEKKRAAIWVSLAAVSLAPMPFILRLIGFFPENHDPLLLPTLLTFATVDIALIIAAQILVTSMVADIVEESQVKTKRRSEGLFFAARTFAHKIVSGMGLFASGLVLTAVNFPQGVAPGQVPQETLVNLALVYIPVLMVFYFGSVAFLTGYRIDRRRHEDNLARIAADEAAPGD